MASSLQAPEGAHDGQHTSPPHTTHTSSSTSVVKPENDAAPNEKPDTPAKLEAASPHHAEEEEARSIHGIKWVLVCAALYITAFLYGLDTTIAADVQASVIATFQSVEQLVWLGSGFPLGSIAVILFVGSMYGKFDQKYVFIGSLVLFEAGSALCGAAPTMVALIVGRVIAGAGGAGIYLGALNYLTQKTRPSERGLYIGLIGLCWGLGTILGPVIGGAFSDSSATWRWAFYINLPIAGIFAPVYLLFLPSVRLDTEHTFFARVTHMDWLGFLLSAGMWTAFTLVLTFAGSTWPWNDGRTIATFIVFGALVVLLALQQKFLIGTTRQNRLLPLHLLRSRTQVLLFIGTSAVIAGFFIPLYYLPLYFQWTAFDSAEEAAVRLLPLLILFVVSNVAAGAVLPRLPWYSVLYLAGGVLFLITGGLYYMITPSTPFAQIYGFEILSGVGAGLTAQAGYTIGTARAPGGMADIVNAVSLQNMAQIGSIVITLVVAGQIFQSVAVRNVAAVLSGQGFTDADVHSAVAGAQSPVYQKLSSAVRDQVVLAITQAMGQVFILMIVAGGVMLVTGILMRRQRLTG